MSFQTSPPTLHHHTIGEGHKHLSEEGEETTTTTTNPLQPSHQANSTTIPIVNTSPSSSIPTQHLNEHHSQPPPSSEEVLDLESQVFEDDDTYTNSNEPLIDKNHSESSQNNNSNNNEQQHSGYFDQSIWKVVYKRGIWLILLLILQSFSSFILATFEALLQKHIIISLFLTMLIGTGGNSGSQSTIEIVRRITTGEIKKSNILSVIWREFRIGILLSIVVGLVAFIRVYFYRVFNMTTEEHMGMPAMIAVFYNGALFKELLALTLSIVAIVVVSVLVCAAIPLVIHFGLGFDAAISSGPMSSVVMDLVGVSITVAICSLVL